MKVGVVGERWEGRREGAREGRWRVRVRVSVVVLRDCGVLVWVSGFGVRGSGEDLQVGRSRRG